jgi:hypothetical protein
VTHNQPPSSFCFQKKANIFVSKQSAMLMMIPKIKETARTTRSVVSLSSSSSSSSSRSSCFQHETTPATATPLPRYKVVNAQSILASILLLFCLDLYVNIADFDRGRRESRKSINGGVGYDVPSQLIDGAIVTEKKEQASRISSDGAPPPSITLSKEKVGNFRVIDEASQQLSVPPAHEHARNSKSSNSDAKNDNINNKKPTLVLHMGPTKTGSTFTQCVLTNMQETLALDNYTYLGMGINPCLPRVQDEESSDFHERRQQLMQHCYNSMFIYNTGHVAKLAPEALSIFRRAAASFVEPRRQNAILVNECFEFYTPDQIKVLVAELRPYWNVKIIMNYRRIYEFLPSSYNQNLKPKSHVKGKVVMVKKIVVARCLSLYFSIFISESLFSNTSSSLLLFNKSLSCGPANVPGLVLPESWTIFRIRLVIPALVVEHHQEHPHPQ